MDAKLRRHERPVEVKVEQATDLADEVLRDVLQVRISALPLVHGASGVSGMPLHRALLPVETFRPHYSLTKEQSTERTGLEYRLRLWTVICVSFHTASPFTTL